MIKNNEIVYVDEISTSSKASVYCFPWECLKEANWALRDNDPACACASTTTKAVANKSFMVYVVTSCYLNLKN